MKCPNCENSLWFVRRGLCPFCKAPLPSPAPRDPQPPPLSRETSTAQQLEICPQPPKLDKHDFEYDDFEELQRVANYLFVRKGLVPSGIGGFIFGIVAIYMGVNGVKENPINAIMAMIGIFLTLQGIWLVLARPPAGLILNGFGLLAAGIWNISVTMMNVSSGAGGVGAVVILGLFQIGWGFQSFVRYGRFSKLPHSKPSAEALARIDQVVKEITLATLANDASVVEFERSASNFSLDSDQQYWKAKLGTTGAIFVQPGRQVIFAKREDIDFEPEGDSSVGKPGKPMKAMFKLGEKAFAGVILPESLARYKTWKVAKPAATNNRGRVAGH